MKLRLAAPLLIPHLGALGSPFTQSATTWSCLRVCFQETQSKTRRVGYSRHPGKSQWPRVVSVAPSSAIQGPSTPAGVTACLLKWERSFTCLVANMEQNIGKWSGAGHQESWTPSQLCHQHAVCPGASLLPFLGLHLITNFWASFLSWDFKRVLRFTFLYLAPLLIWSSELPISANFTSWTQFWGAGWWNNSSGEHRWVLIHTVLF
jgi:hypothetical protein